MAASDHPQHESPHPEQTRLVAVPGRRLALTVSGAGGPTVVLETGLEAPSEAWQPVQEAVAGVTRVVRFDRAGRGQSDPAPTPRTCDDMVADLRALLRAADIPPPYVLVGNSLGGMNARLYAHRHPDEVVGLVLVDAAHQDQFARIGGAMPPAEVLPEAARGFHAFWAGGGWRDPANNREGVDFVASGAQLREISTLGELPMTVLVSGAFLQQGGHSPGARQLHALWVELQRELAGLSAAAELRVLEASGHFIQQDQPGVVADAIRDVIEAASRARGTTP